MPLARSQQFIEEAVDFVAEHHRTVVSFLCGISLVYHVAILLLPPPYSPPLFYTATAMGIGLTFTGMVSYYRKNSIQAIYNYAVAIVFFWMCVDMIAGVLDKNGVSVWMVLDTLLLSLIMLSFLPMKKALPLTGALYMVFFVATLLMEANNWMVAINVGVLLVLSVYLTLYGATIHSERLKNTELEQKLLYDGLTGVLNRHSIEDEFEKILRKRRGIHEEYYVLMLDLDHFKSFNDKYGHLIGDRVLQSVAAAMQTLLGKNGHVGRWGGEEFIAWVKVHSFQEALDIAEALRERVTTLHTEVPDLIEAELHQITISIGMSELRSGEELKTAIERADDLLYTAKRSGRNRVVSDSLADRLRA